MKRTTWTVVSGFTDRDGRHWAYLRGLGGKYQTDSALPEGTAVIVKDGKAVRA